MEDICNQPLFTGDICFFARWGRDAGIGVFTHETPMARGSITLFAKTKTGKVSTRYTEPSNILKLSPWYDREDNIPDCVGNVKSRTDITGKPLKAGHIIAYAWIASGKTYSGQMYVGIVQPFGPRGGAKVSNILGWDGKLKTLVNDDNQTYVEDCLILNEDLKNRILLAKLTS